MLSAIFSGKANQLKSVWSAVAPKAIMTQSRLSVLRDNVLDAKKRLKNCGLKRESKKYKKLKRRLSRAVGKYNNEKKSQNPNENSLPSQGQR